MPCGPKRVPGAVGRAAVERGAEHGDVVLAAAAHVLDVRRLEEGVDAGEVRQLAAAEGRDRACRRWSRRPAGRARGRGRSPRPASWWAARPRRAPRRSLRGRSCRAPREARGRRRGSRRACGGGSATALLTSGAGRRSSRHHQLSPGLLSRRGTAREPSASLGPGLPCLIKSGKRNPRRASPVRESRTVKAPGVATACSACFRPVTPPTRVGERADSRRRTCRLAPANVPTRGGIGARSLDVGPRPSRVGVRSAVR